MLEGQLLAHYFMLERHYGTREKLAESKRTDISNYMFVKKGYLRLIYTCALFSGYENAESLAQAALGEMMQAVDRS